MNKISCDMCIDLMPLVQDGVASEDSRNAVLQHLQECPDCRALYEGEIPTPSNTKEILGKVKRRAQLFSAMVMMFGIFYGLMLTAGNGIFMNVIIMPIIGGIGHPFLQPKDRSHQVRLLGQGLRHWKYKGQRSCLRNHSTILEPTYHL